MTSEGINGFNSGYVGNRFASHGMGEKENFCQLARGDLVHVCLAPVEQSLFDSFVTIDPNVVPLLVAIPQTHRTVGDRVVGEASKFGIYPVGQRSELDIAGNYYRYVIVVKPDFGLELARHERFAFAGGSGEWRRKRADRGGNGHRCRRGTVLARVKVALVGGIIAVHVIGHAGPRSGGLSILLLRGWRDRAVAETHCIGR